MSLAVKMVPISKTIVIIDCKNVAEPRQQTYLFKGIIHDPNKRFCYG